MNTFKKVILIGMVLFVSACASTLKPDDLSTVKSVGILNNFPDNPNFVTIGTTIFNNEYAQINDPQFSNTLSNTIIQYLESKGFQATLINENQTSDFDMVLELIPRDVYATPGTHGFGVNQRSMFGNPMQANTYVALNITPIIDGKKKCSACYLQKLLPIEIEELPPTWEELSAEQKEHVAEILNQNITESLRELLIDTGI